MTTFKQGDRVRCIDPVNSFSKDQVYEVSGYNQNEYACEGGVISISGHHAAFASRFELVVPFSKDDLKSGMLIEFKDGNHGIVIDDMFIYDEEHDGYDRIEYIHDDLSRLGFSKEVERDILAVWSTPQQPGRMFRFTTKGRALLYTPVPTKPDKVELTSDYTAVINYANETVQVGCQIIPYAKVEELYKMIQANK